MRQQEEKTWTSDNTSIEGLADFQSFKYVNIKCWHDTVNTNSHVGKNKFYQAEKNVMSLR